MGKTANKIIGPNRGYTREEDSEGSPRTCRNIVGLGWPVFSVYSPLGTGIPRSLYVCLLNGGIQAETCILIILTNTHPVYYSLKAPTITKL